MYKPKIIAHRGYSLLYRENTLPAFEAAFRAGADFVELDLVLTADGRVFVNHDLTVGRYLIRTVKLKEIKNLIPGSVSLEEVLLWAERRRIGLYLDVKDRDMINPLTEILKDFVKGKIDVIVSSDDFTFLKKFKEKNEHILTALLFRNILPSEEMIRLANKYKADIIHPCWERKHPYPHVLIDRENITTMNSAGYKVVCWHEERREELVRLLKIGFWGITTDDPFLLRNLINQSLKR